MERRVNSFDVAKLAGVSQATVSYVLNDRKGQSIGIETRRRVRNAAETLGYQPNRAARSLAGGRTGVVALWVPHAYHSVFNNTSEQIMRLARENGVHITIVQTAGETRETLAANGYLSSGNIDGIIVVDEVQLIDDIIEWQPDRPPIVSIGPLFSNRVDHVGVEIQDGARSAVRHLLTSGCNRIAHATFEGGWRERDPRYLAYVEVMKEAGRPLEFIMLERGEYDDTYRTIRQRFADGSYPDGLHCWNDEAAIGANRALADLGLLVPTDVAVIGSDGVREMEFSVPSLSTMAQPFEEMCRMSWQYLYARMDDPLMAIQAVTLPMRLIARQSTGHR